MHDESKMVKKVLGEDFAFDSATLDGGTLRLVLDGPDAGRGAQHAPALLSRWERVEVVTGDGAQSFGIPD